MSRFALLGLLALAACKSDYSPDTYATRAVQQANKVEQGTIVGVRQVNVSAEGSTGAATGAAAGGVLGAQTPGGGIGAALGTVGGALVGGLIGTAAEHTVVDTIAFEYVVRTEKDELVSVTQRDNAPLPVGQHVLVISGNQARIVADYTVRREPATARPASPSGPPPPGGEPAPVAAPASAGGIPIPQVAPPVIVPPVPAPPLSAAPIAAIAESLAPLR